MASQFQTLQRRRSPCPLIIALGGRRAGSAYLDLPSINIMSNFPPPSAFLASRCSINSVCTFSPVGYGSGFLNTWYRIAGRALLATEPLLELAAQVFQAGRQDWKSLMGVENMAKSGGNDGPGERSKTEKTMQVDGRSGG